MKLDPVAADACVGAVVERYRAVFTRHCTCGDPECAEPQLASPTDYRVVSCSIFAASTTALGLIRSGDLCAAIELLEASRRFAEPALTTALEADFDVDAVKERLDAVATPDEREIMAMIQAELVETTPDTPAITLDPEEVDELWAATPSRGERDA